MRAVQLHLGSMMRGFFIGAAVALFALASLGEFAHAAPPTHVQTYTAPTLVPTSPLSEAKFDNSASSGDTTVISGVGGQTVKVYQIFFICAAATNITFKDGTTALTGAINQSANQGPVLDISAYPWFTTSTGNGFVINSSVATQCSGRVYYVQS